MKIIGSRTLNANNYRAISIHKNVNVFGNSLSDGIITSEPLTKSLRGKSDQEKIEEVIRYFIRNHTIEMIFESIDEISLISSDDIRLSISRNHILSKELISEIKNKYYMDRMETYSNSDVDFYWINASSLYADSKSTSYGVGRLKDIKWMTSGLPTVLKGKEGMLINISMRYKYEEGTLKEIKIDSIDNEFLGRMLSDIESASFYGNPINNDLCIYKCRKDDKDVYLVIDKEVWEFIYDIDMKIEEDKKERIKSKKLQYRMEEF